MSEVDSGAAAPTKKYGTYDLKVDPREDDRAAEINLCSFSRPHMRAFHCAWWSFFVAFFIWFAIVPLLPEIRDTLELSDEQIWTSSIVSVGGTILMRLALGPACDKYGARVLFTVLLCFASVPTALTGLINSARDLALVRLFIGFAGGSFVMCQYWTTCMFTKNVIGTANALVGGWGNLGAGVTQLVMGSILFPLFRNFFGNDSEMAWRTVSVVPAVVAFATGIIVYYISDDAPKGNFKEMKRNGTMPQVSAIRSLQSGICNYNTWILSIQYACCFGVELTMNNAAALYFEDQFLQSTESAAAIASIFGWMNLFARGLGGFISDYFFFRMGMRGRILIQTICLFGEGSLVLIFANTHTLAGAIIVLVFFSLFVQAAEGTTYGIVPYVDSSATGSIAGIVGAGGNAGAVAFGMGFRGLDYKDAYSIMGGTVLASTVLSLFLLIRGQSSLWSNDAWYPRGELDSEASDHGDDGDTSTEPNNEGTA